GVTEFLGPSANVFAQLGVGAIGTDPRGNADWTWTNATFANQVGNNDEYVALTPNNLAPGAYAYAYRFGISPDGQVPISWTYADLDGSSKGFSIDHPGLLRVA